MGHAWDVERERAQEFLLSLAVGDGTEEVEIVLWDAPVQPRVAEVSWMSDQGKSGSTAFQSDPDCAATILGVERLLLAYHFEGQQGWDPDMVSEAEAYVKEVTA